MWLRTTRLEVRVLSGTHSFFEGEVQERFNCLVSKTMGGNLSHASSNLALTALRRVQCKHFDMFITSYFDTFSETFAINVS